MSTGYTFDDVMFEPQYSDIGSRSEVKLDSKVGHVKLELPIVSANMADITEENMIKAMHENGGLGIMHRFMSIKENVEMFLNCKNKFKIPVDKIGVSIGVGEREKNRFKKLLEAGATIFCIDVAHGHHISVKNMLKWIKTHEEYKLGKLTIIAGNVASVSGAYDLYKWGAHVVKIGVGPGCLKEGTRILMSDGGYKNIEDVKAGEKVINMNGVPVKVKNVFSTGFKKVRKITNSIFYEPLYATACHKCFIGDLSSCSLSTTQSKGYKKCLSQSSKYKWKEVWDLNRDVFLTPNNIEFELKKTFKVSFPNPSKNKFQKICKNNIILSPSYGLGYIFGTFLGDGNAPPNTGRVSWAFSLNEKEKVDKLNSYIKEYFGKELIVKIPKGRKILLATLYYKNFSDFMVEFGKHNNKKLPNKYLIDNREYLKGIFDGLIDSDGNIEKSGRICLTNTSKNIIETFGIITFLLTDSFPNSREHGRNVGGLESVNFKNVKMSYRSRINTASKKRILNNFQISKVLSKNKVEEFVETFDIHVDCSTHSFIANNVIVHNSCCQTRENTGVGVPQLGVLEAIRKYFNEMNISDKCSIISDGGIKKTGDITKALVYADAVMVGGFLAGTSETPGYVYETMNGEFYKTMAGSASAEAKTKYGKEKEFVEGGIRQVPFRGHVKYVLQKAKENVQSGFSYSGARNIDELREKSVLVKISSGGKKESKL